MCTTFAKKIDGSWYLGKTRDPVEWMRWDDELKLFFSKEDRFRKMIIQNPDPKQDGFYGGINEKGVSFVSTYVNVSEAQISYIRKPYVRLILDAANADEAVDIIRAFRPRIGGNMFVADPLRCFAIESKPDVVYVEEIFESAVKTNHFIHFKDKNIEYENDPLFEKWSTTRYNRAVELLSHAKTIDDFKEILKDRKHEEQGISICRTREKMVCFTHSAFIFDSFSAAVHYCQGNPSEKVFKEYLFWDK